MDRRADANFPITRTQIDELERHLRPVIARFMSEPETDTSVSIICIPVRDDPNGAAIMRFEVQVRGKPITSEDEQRIAHFLRGGPGPSGVST
jgi:hypothetical protein